MDEMYLFKSQDEGNRLLYAYYKGEFWFYDPNVQQWYISGHVREQYELARQKEDGLTPDDFTCTGYGYEFVAEYEISVSVLDALRTARKAQPKEDEPCKTGTAPTGAAAATTDASAAPMQSKKEETSTGSAENSADASSCPSAEPAPQAPAALPLSAPDTAPMSLPAFDYSVLDADTAEHLQKLARRAMQAKQRYILDMMEIVAEAHRELVALCDKRNNQYSESTFRAWCASIGVGKDTAYRLLQVQALIDGSTPEEQEALAKAPATLLYAAAKPSAPTELVQAVKDGDITTHKQYQDLLAQYNAEKAAREQAEREAALDRKEQEDANAAALRYKNECDRRAQEQQRLEGLVSTAQRRATEAENRAAGAQKLADQRGSENAGLKARLRELESRPVDIAVAEPTEADKERWRKEGEDRMAATLQDAVLQAHKGMVDAQNRAATLEEEAGRLRGALNRAGQLDTTAAMACGSCAAALAAWFESCARDLPDDLAPALARMRRLRLALDTAIEYGTWPDDGALDELEAEVIQSGR